MSPTRWTSLARILCIGLIAGCLDNGIIPTPPPPPPPPGMAVILVTTISIGSLSDPNGYVLKLDNQNYAQLAGTGEREFTTTQGSHTLELTDIADPCEIS